MCAEVVPTTAFVSRVDLGHAVVAAVRDPDVVGVGRDVGRVDAGGHRVDDAVRRRGRSRPASWPRRAAPRRRRRRSPPRPRRAAARRRRRRRTPPRRRRDEAAGPPRGGAAIAWSWFRISLLELAVAPDRARARVRRRAFGARPGSSPAPRTGGPSGRARASAGRAAARASDARRPGPRAHPPAPRGGRAPGRPRCGSRATTRCSSSSRAISF